jgi:hypothetical protein
MAYLARPLLPPSNTTTVPLFLAPAFARAVPVSIPSTTHFSTSTPLCRASATRKQAGLKAKTEGKPNWALQQRPKIDRNKQRGVSAIRRTGPRSMRGLWNHPLPVPVARDHKTIDTQYIDSHDHGLWGFFNRSRQALLEPEQVSSHGTSLHNSQKCVKGSISGLTTCATCRPSMGIQGTVLQILRRPA